MLLRFLRQGRGGVGGGVCCRPPFYGLAGRKSMKKKNTNFESTEEKRSEPPSLPPLSYWSAWFLDDPFYFPTIRLVKSPGFWDFFFYLIKGGKKNIYNLLRFACLVVYPAIIESIVLGQKSCGNSTLVTADRLCASQHGRPAPFYVVSLWDNKTKSKTVKVVSPAAFRAWMSM